MKGDGNAGDDPGCYESKTRHWIAGRPDRRLRQAIGELELRLQWAEPVDDAQRAAKRRAVELLDCAKRELDRYWAANHEAWVWFHAARQEALRLRPSAELALLEIDLDEEAEEKLGSWRRKAVGNSRSQNEPPIDRIVRMQRHLDATADNENRKRLLQRGQLLIYLGLLFMALLVICGLEFAGQGLLVPDDGIDGWWVVSAACYGTLGGAFSSAQRVAAGTRVGRYPQHRLARMTNTFRPLAGGAGALVAFAALQTGLLGDAGSSGPRVALVAFAAGFTERFIPSLASRQTEEKG